MNADGVTAKLDALEARAFGANAGTLAHVYKLDALALIAIARAAEEKTNHHATCVCSLCIALEELP